jgi:hypothetical protein
MRGQKVARSWLRDVGTDFCKRGIFKLSSTGTNLTKHVQYCFCNVCLFQCTENVLMALVASYEHNVKPSRKETGFYSSDPINFGDSKR